MFKGIEREERDRENVKVKAKVPWKPTIKRQCHPGHKLCNNVSSGGAIDEDKDRGPQFIE